ncbi:MAG: DUF4286 family protein [Bacteroidia bacterium]|nr:DUF4286 family protein [Bacteroidia bacterium]
MFIYNVTVNIEDSVKTEWIEWMRAKHIPDVIATGCFLSHRICKLLAVEDQGATYCIQYFFNTMEDLNRYQEQHAPRLQKDHMEKYGSKAVAFRTLMEVVE